MRLARTGLIRQPAAVQELDAMHSGFPRLIERVLTRSDRRSFAGIATVGDPALAAAALPAVLELASRWRRRRLVVAARVRALEEE